MKPKLFPFALMITLVATVFLTAAAPSPFNHPPFPFTLPDGGIPTHDYGDAPDSGNTAGAVFEAYPGVPGNYPTTLSTNGPWHDNATPTYFLGSSVSGEELPDSGPDNDVDGNNLVITGTMGLAANNDGADNGLTLPNSLPHCKLTTLEYTITVDETQTGSLDAYVNVWMDWDRSGAWGGAANLCPGMSTGVTEWAVENMPVTLTGPGTYTFMTPAFMSWNPDPDQTMWIRISVGDQMAIADDGTGVAAGYTYGETEDYLWSMKHVTYLPLIIGGGGATTQPPPDDDEVHIDESIPTEVQFEWPQIPDDNSSVVLDIDNLLLSFANNSEVEQQISYSLTIVSGGEKTIHRSEPVNIGPGDIKQEPVPVGLLLPAIQAAREAARMLGEVKVMDLTTGVYYNVEISFIVIHPDEDDPDGKIVAYNALGLARQMEAMEFDHNAALGAALLALIPDGYDSTNLTDLVVYEEADPVVNEVPTDGGDDFPEPQAIENSPDSPDAFAFTVCLEWFTAPIDNGFGEDYGLNDDGWRARGAKVAIVQGNGAGNSNLLFSGYLNRYGCTSLSTASTNPVMVLWFGEVRLESGGGYITIKHLTSTSNDSGDLAGTYAVIGSVSANGVYRPEIMNYDSLGILSYAAQERFNGGVNGATYYLKIAGCGDDPDQGSCATNVHGNPGIYMSSGQQRRKFIVGHEYGHRVLASAANYANDCSFGDSGHGMTTLEYGSCAAMEGWGHYVAVDIWNYHVHGDSGNLNPDGIIVYWDGKNTVYSAETGLDQAYCLDKFSSLTLVCAFFGYELDWFRQWWDFHTNPGNRATHAEMFNMVDAVVWENGTFDVSTAIEGVLGPSLDRWHSHACWNGVHWQIYCD